MAVTVEQLQEQINTISKQVAQRFAQQQASIIQNQVRLESLIRMVLAKQGIPFDDYISYIDSYVAFTNKLNEVNKIEFLYDRVNAALDFNTTAVVKIHADDLNLLPVIKSTGGANSKLVSKIYSLPYSTTFSAALTSILKEEEAPKEN